MTSCYVHFKCISINNFQVKVNPFLLSSILEILPRVLGPVLRTLAGLLVVSSNALVAGASSPSKHGVPGQQAGAELGLGAHLELSVGQHGADGLDRTDGVPLTEGRSGWTRTHPNKNREETEGYSRPHVGDSIVTRRLGTLAPLVCEGAEGDEK